MKDNTAERLGHLLEWINQDEGSDITENRFGAEEGQFYMIQNRDSRFWFYAISKNKIGSYKGLQVVWYDDKRGPGKAVTRSQMMGSPWVKVDKKDVPVKVMTRFDDKM